MKLLLHLPLDPKAKPRMTSSDRWKTEGNPDPKKRRRRCVSRYFAYRDAVRLLARGWTPPECDYWIVFTIPAPYSMSKKKRAERIGRPHQQTPDKDNLEKAFLDCFGDDAHIWDGRVSKVWGDTGSIDVYQTKEFAEGML